MPAIIIIAILSALRYFEFGPFAKLSWWWIIGLMFAAFIWFEFLEHMFGLDAKSRSHDELDKVRQERVKKAFEKKR